MDGTLFRVCGAGLLCVILCVILKQVKPEFLPLARVSGTVLILLTVVPVLWNSISSVGALLTDEGVEPYARVMLRALGVSLLTKVCCDVCHDTGESALANGVELAGKAVILLLCVPLIEEILGYAAKILEKA